MRLEALPRQFSQQEIHEPEADPFHVVSPRLFNAEMRIERSISRCPRQGLALLHLDMLSCGRVPVRLAQAEIDDMYDVGFPPEPDQEIVRLEVSMQEAPGVQELDPRQHLVDEHEHSLEGELALAVVEEVFEAGAEEVEHHGIVVAFGAVPVDLGNAGTATQNFVEFGFVEELGMFGLA